MHPITFSYTPADDDTDGYADDATAAAGDPIPLAATSPGDGLGHLVIITPSGAIADDFTISGLDADGQAQSEVLASDAANAVTSTLYYSQVDEVLAATLGAETVDIGWTDDVVGPVYPLNWRQTDFQVTLAVVVTGTINYTVQYTVENLHPQVLNVPDPEPSTLNWFPHDTLVGDTANAVGNIVVPVTAIRLLLNSFTAGATIALTVLQGN